MATQDNSKRWGQIHIKPWWSTSYKDLPYINEPFNDSASVNLWRQLGYTQEKFTGDMYNMNRPEPSWIDEFRNHFKWDHFSWSVYRMGPGTTLPNHSDTYTRFKELYNIIDDSTIYRAIVLLGDWESGHYLEIDGRPIVNWIAGDTVIWQSDVPHLAANVGMTDRYTLQITGVSIENIFSQ
jgi:hypothetical protein